MPDFSGHEFLGIDENSGESGGQDEADDHAQNASPEEIGVGQHQSEGKNAQDRAPDNVFASDFVAHRTADVSSRGDSRKKQEEVQLRALNGKVELAHEIKRVVVH